MTVASLWKALDRAGCGKNVGKRELLDHHSDKSKMNPWNHREMSKLSKSPPVLAVDLSIWICEALASTGMKHNHVADPPLQLVYSRVLKLLNLGIKLVVVVEGKRRSRIRKEADEESNPKPMQEKFRKRRSGAPFWTACERCEAMLKLLGVIVVRATAEGEALCALLNQRGIVDGVISNDGDCLLFGAKVLYTKFSVENLDNSSIIRYDASDIRVVLDDDDADRFDETGRKSKYGQDVVELSRKDLIAFAILTGSDLAGEGLSKVGCRKAIRFIRKCQIDNPLKVLTNEDSSPALEQLLSWEQTAAKGNLEEEQDGPHCGCCGHPGTKRDHKKHGCKGCGTESGEPCFPLSPGGRFRKMLRAKAISMQSSFDPSSTAKAYYEPNDGQIPLCLLGKTAKTLQMNPPQTQKLLELTFIIRGRSLQESREYVQKSLSTYLARREILELLSKPATKGEKPTKLPRNNNRPIPVFVTKLMVRNGKPSCQVQWKIKATTSDAEGNPLNEFEFSTIEDESTVQKCYPKLLQDFQEEQKKIQQQGSAEQEKRRNFLLSMERSKELEGAEIQLNGTKKNQARKDYFDQTGVIPKSRVKRRGVSDDVAAILVPVTTENHRTKDGQHLEKTIDAHIGRLISTEFDGFAKASHQKHVDLQGIVGDVCIDDASTICTDSLLRDDKIVYPAEDYVRNALTPGHEHYLGIESMFQFRCMAGDSFHPKLNYVKSISRKDKPVISSKTNKVDHEKTVVFERDVSSRNRGADSVCRELLPQFHTNGNRTASEPLEKFSHHKRAKRPRTSTALLEEEGLYHTTKKKKRHHEDKRKNQKVIERNNYSKDGFLHGGRVFSEEEYPTRVRDSKSNSKFLKQTNGKAKFEIYVDTEDERWIESEKDALEFSSFNFLPLERNQSNRDLDYEFNYCRAQSRTAKRRKRDRDRQFENEYGAFECDFEFDDEASCPSWNLCHEERKGNVQNLSEKYGSRILQDACQNVKFKEPGLTKLRMEKYRYNNRNQHKNESKNRKGHTSYGKRDENRRCNYYSNQSDSFNELRPQIFEFEDRKDSKNLFCSNLFEERGVHRSRGHRVEKRSYSRRDRSISTKENDTTTINEIEKRVAADIESLTRRAELNRLYLKYIKNRH